MKIVYINCLKLGGSPAGSRWGFDKGRLQEVRQRRRFNSWPQFVRIHRSGPFRRDFAQLPKLIKRRAEKALRLLIQNLRHPSLEARIVDKKRRIWKAKVNGGYRLTFQLERDTITLRRIGSHGPMERP